MKPEDFRAYPTTSFHRGKRTKKSWQDGREIYIYGERVKDAHHPAFMAAFVI